MLQFFLLRKPLKLRHNTVSMTAQSLTELRKNIDDIDSQLVALLNERARLAVAIGRSKAQTGKVVYDPTRERAVLGKIDSLNQGPLPKGSLEDIYAAIITACREIQL